MFNADRQLSENYILLTIDVEDWFQVENLRPWNPPSTWKDRELRVEKSTQRILDLLDSFTQSSPTSITSNLQSVNRNPVSATFFILGWIASRCPGLVRKIRDRGHEVASHGDGHLLCTEISSAALEQDLKKSKRLLEDICGKEIMGYRAPSFSINEKILELIYQAGYKYDSSYNSFALNPRYGRVKFQGSQQKKGIAIPLKEDFYELPISNLRLANKIIPWGGGGYFRLIPSKIFSLGVRKILHTDKTYVIYLHPWEFDPDQPRVKEVTWQFGFRHYINLHKTEAKLETLLNTFKKCNFVSCAEYLGLGY